MGYPFGSTGSHRTGGMRTPALIFLIPPHYADDLAPCCTFPEKSGARAEDSGKRSHQELKISKKVQQRYRAFVKKSGKIGELPGKSPAQLLRIFKIISLAIRQFRKKTDLPYGSSLHPYRCISYRNYSRQGATTWIYRSPGL